MSTEPKGQVPTVTKHIQIGFLSKTDIREPKQVQLMIQDANWEIETLAILSAEEFTALMSGLAITVQAEL